MTGQGDLRKDLRDRAVEIALDERLGGVRPPDLTAAVLGKLADERPAPRSGRSWLAAAAMLLGAAVVVTVLALDRAERARDEPHGALDTQQDPVPEPEIVRPKSIDELRALLAQSTGVDVRVRSDRGIDLDPRGPGQMRGVSVERQGLRVLADAPLVLREPALWAWAQEIDVHVGDGEALRLAWNPIADILGVEGLGDVGIGARGAQLMDDLVAQAGRSARLQQGQLLGAEIVGEAAADLPFPAGGRLSLHEASAEQVAAVTALPWIDRVRALSLEGCRHRLGVVGSIPVVPHAAELVLDGCTLRPGLLPELLEWQDLERVSLRAVEFAATERFEMPPTQGIAWLIHQGMSVDLQFARVADEYGFPSGDIEPALPMGPWPPRDFEDTRRPTTLDISDTPLGGGMLRTLQTRRAPHLQVVVARRRPPADHLTDADCELLAGFPGVMRLDLAGQTGITDRGLEALAKAPALRALDLSGCSGVTREGIDALRAAARAAGRELVVTITP